MKIAKNLVSRKFVLAVLTGMSILGLSAVAKADITGDFQLTSATYGTGISATDYVAGDGYGGDVVISGTVNNGAIQSGKVVVVNVSYDYSFEYQIGEDVTTIKTVYCPNEKSNDDACKDQRKKDTDVVRIITTIVNDIKTYNASGMTAITEPAVDSKGRLNPKGKITGYDWVYTVSILPSTITPDPNLIPEGGSLVPDSVEITGVSYTAYLKDKNDLQIADTMVSGILFSAPPAN